MKKISFPKISASDAEEFMKGARLASSPVVWGNTLTDQLIAEADRKDKSQVVERRKLK